MIKHNKKNISEVSPSSEWHVTMVVCGSQGQPPPPSPPHELWVSSRVATLCLFVWVQNYNWTHLLGWHDPCFYMAFTTFQIIYKVTNVYVTLLHSRSMVWEDPSLPGLHPRQKLYQFLLLSLKGKYEMLIVSKNWRSLKCFKNNIWKTYEMCPWDLVRLFEHIPPKSVTVIQVIWRR